MKCTRLFVGGLDDSIDNQLLTTKLSKYGKVSDIELKEKKDAEGNVSFRFAYINIEAAPYQIEDCVSQLNGSVWSGSRLRIEVAKESFLDRLKRERTKTQDHQQKAPVPIQSKSPKKLQTLTSSNVSESLNKESEQTSLQADTGGKKKRKGILQDSDTSAPNKNTSFSCNDVKSPKKKQKSNKKNEAEEEMMASFKTFSSVWADSDEEADFSDPKKSINMSENKNVLQDHHPHNRVLMEDESDSSDEYSEDSDESCLNEETQSYQDKRKNWGIPGGGSKFGSSESDSPSKKMTRYDPTRPEHQHFRILPSSQSKEAEQQSESHQEPEVAKASGFSFLKMFDQLQNDESAVGTPAKWNNQSLIKEAVYKDEVNPHPYSHLKEIESIPETSVCLSSRKSHPFFLSMKDDRLQEGLNWMMQNDQYHVISEYQAVESDLYNVIKTRSTRAKREARKERIDNENKRKSSKHKDTEVSVTEDQYYDYAWRRAVHLEEIRKSRGRGNAGPPHQGRDVRYSQERDHISDGSTRSRFSGETTFTRGRGRGDHISGRGRGDHISGRGRGDHISGRGRGYETSGRGRGGTHAWGRGRGDISDWGRGRSGNHSRGRGRGNYHNKDHSHSRINEEGGDYLTQG